MIALEGNMDLTGLFVIIILIMVGPPILLTIIGFAVKKRHKTLAKVLFILGGLYLLISLGICGSMIS